MHTREKACGRRVGEEEGANHGAGAKRKNRFAPFFFSASRRVQSLPNLAGFHFSSSFSSARSRPRTAAPSMSLSSMRGRSRASSHALRSSWSSDARLGRWAAMLLNFVVGFTRIKSNKQNDWSLRPCQSHKVPYCLCLSIEGAHRKGSKGRKKERKERKQQERDREGDGGNVSAHSHLGWHVHLTLQPSHPCVKRWVLFSVRLVTRAALANH